MRQQAWSERAYQNGHRLLRRARLQRVLDYRFCSILASGQPGLPPSPWDEEALWLGEARAAQASWLAELEPERAREFPQRWADGLRCFAAALRGTRAEGALGLAPTNDQRCVGFLWVAVGPRRLAGQASGYVWELPAGSAWLFDAFVHPLVLGTYPDLARYATLRLRAEGASWILGQVECGNRVSRRVHHLLGGQPVGWVASLRCGGLRLHLDRSHQAWRLRWGRAPTRLAAFLPASAPAAAERRAA
ncbi:MAG TPA: hypothetical protein VMV31_07750 [Terriglobales bacterium]|nr:hypothetical protein [Terriglobales bacterium]